MDDYKEKYENGVECIQEILSGAADLIRTTTLRKRLQPFFPELKESKEDKIMRAIRGWIYTQPSQFFDGDFSKEEMLAWVEKHGKQNLVEWSEEDEKIKESIKKVLANTDFNKLDIKYSFCEMITWLEKQKDYIKFPNSAYTSNKDVIEFADKYSHDVWEKLMDNFKKIENYHIGCNDVSDIVLNAIINTYNWLEKQDKEEHALKSSRDEDVDKFMQYIEKQAKAYEFNLPNKGYDIYAFAKDILHWLEKQDEKKHIFNADDWYVSEVDGKIHNAKFIEKQDGEKPTDEAEPKFKPGDWIVFNGLTLHIDEVVNCYPYGYYRTTSRGDGIHNSYDWNIDNAARLWTIEEARVGAVLVDEDNNIGIYVGKNDDFWHSCIYLGCDNYLHGINVGAYHKHKNTKPATKEQRDLLFSKMKEEGYEWDPKKKEVKTIEQKPAESTKDYNDIDPHFGIPVEDLMSTDKTEPKFKVRDWIANGGANPCYVKSIFGDYYELCSCEGFEYTKHIIDVNYIYHLWTIADAKDGDVLCYETKNDFKIFIYKQGHIHYHCCYSNGHLTPVDSFFTLQKHLLCYIQPATKEQRNLLFQKMKEEGYKWDAEKQEVKAIEQTPEDKVESKFKVGNWYQCIKDFFGKGVTFDKGTAYYCAKEGCLLDGCHIAIVKDLYDNFKLWTIEDAKDGDVLTANVQRGELGYDDYPFRYIPITFIYRKTNNDDYYIHSHCDMCFDGILNSSYRVFAKDFIKDIHPAAEGQRDLLFQKIKEEGYEWDDEEKELKRIEPNILDDDNVLLSLSLGNNQVQDILEDMGMLDDNGQCPHTAEEIFKAGMEHAFNLNREAASSQKVK